MKRWIWSLLLLVVVLPSSASALDCAKRDASFEEEYAVYDGVILAAVEKVEEDGPVNRLHVNVLESYKGVEVDRITVNEDATWGSVSGPSQPGGEYLFFLKKKESEWTVPLCSPTVFAVDVSADKQAFLDPNKMTLKPAAETPEPSNYTLQILWSISGACIGIAAVIVWMRRRKER
ncbi:hypothetical protein [Paenibacillus spongiae]|uniref:Gram-positive cocci surface proteins LPxTG domain-containing protein n=1 Tax=Paenibacillus spongiae TaxID=2909671 RepID=A0ABY5S1L4_9BACL|nr:hypothetical protein [Paenibacillus spongiae]UVI27544.1 hypothetical protein L1F29_18930 [Paenibacillus spongiae]